MSEVKVEKYAATYAVSDDADEDLLAMTKFDAVNFWRRAVARAGYLPLDSEPDAILDTSIMPFYIEDLKLPDRQWRVEGRVVPKATPLP